MGKVGTYTIDDSYIALCNKYAAKNNLDVNLVFTCLVAESSGEVKATSPAGAGGLMQVMPETFNGLTSAAGVSGGLYDPDSNIAVGSLFLSQLISKYGLPGAYAAYNCGPGAWEGFNCKLDTAYDETKKHVPKCLIAYKNITGNDMPSYTGSVGKTDINVSAGIQPTGDSSSSSSSTSVKHNTSDPEGILKFAGFAASLSFQDSLRNGFESSVEQTLHDFLASFMQKFYHNMYYIPTLPSNKCVVIKPELLFVDPPSCNIIYPAIRASGSYNRQPRAEPTRVLLISDPVSKLFGTQNGSDVYNIATLAYIDYADPKNKAGALVVKGFKAMGSTDADISRPIGIISEYEKDNGIRIMRSSKGADLYLFLLSESGTTGNTKVVTNEKSSDKVADVLFKLASYTLQRARYECRPGSYNMYFNPYIVPGFPMINLEVANNSNLNTHAYVTDVVHQIDANGWNTSVSTTASHVFPDPKPLNFPIIEEEYTTQIDSTYDSMLGPAVKRIKFDTAINDTITTYGATSGTATEAYKLIWRPLTTMAEHLVAVCDNAEATVDGNGILILKGAFFNATVQATLVAYTTGILAGTAYSSSDVS